VIRFVHQMVDMLVADHVQVRDAVRDQLGSDLSPVLFPRLFRQIQNILANFIQDGAAPTTQDVFTNFVDQAVSVLCLVLDRLHGPLPAAAADGPEFDLEGLVTSCFRYAHALGTAPLAVRIRTRICQLCEILLTRSDATGFGQGVLFRNRLLDFLVNWSSTSKPVCRLPSYSLHSG
jgi:hypothetical protein